MGLQRETASRGTLAIYTQACLLQDGSLNLSQLLQVVFAVALEFIAFHTTPPALSIAGTLIIMSSAIYTSVLPSHLSLIPPTYTPIAGKEDCLEANHQRDLCSATAHIP